jgi:glycerophosphoryl diester phosphodiesterase
MKRDAVMLMICLGLCSCTPQYVSGPGTSDDFDWYDVPMTPLSDGGRAVMNGVYQVVKGTDVLGHWVVGKWIDQPWCLRWALYSQDDVWFAECVGGSSGDSIKFIGKIRQVRSGSVLQAKLKILDADGARQILSGATPTNIVIQGSLDDGRTIVLKRARNLYVDPPSYQFHILAHQCGGRNSDRLGYSENSIPMIQHAAIFGADGVEMDVRLTRDKHVIVFHDNTFSPRTVKGTYLLGDVKNFDLAQIKSLGRLINGEQIPTVREALTTVVEDTKLIYVWLDVKDAEAVDSIITIQRAMMDLPAARSRGLDILMGIPAGETDIRNAYLSSQNPYKPSVGFLTEAHDDELLSLPNCRAWAPYWAEANASDIAAARGTGKKVFIWTVDLRDIISDYVIGGSAKVDGILTNYSSLARGIHDSR